MFAIKAIGVALGFTLMSSAGIVAAIGLWISLRRSADLRRHRKLIAVGGSMREENKNPDEPRISQNHSRERHHG
jgi:hypothetical protein